MGETPKPLVDSGIAPVPPQESQGAEHKVNSKYVDQETGVPSDPATITMLKEYADAWGEYANEWKRQGWLDEDRFDDKLKRLESVELEKAISLQQALDGASVDIRRGIVSWKGGMMLLKF